VNVKALDHIHIYSLTPQASAAFWQSHLGAQKVFDTRNNHDQEVRIFRVGGQNLAFSEFPPGMAPDKRVATSAAAGGNGMGSSGVMHLGINVDDVAAAVAELRRAGVTVHSEPATAHGVTFAYVEAPDGVLIELTQY
jgi:catechol 2,3-dioxygenase-like lactoylglutathione lyase family enzyme